MEEHEELQLYLDGELIGEHRESFEKRIELDPELKERVRLHQRLEEGFIDPVEDSIERELQALVGEEEVEEKPLEKRRPAFRVYWLVAAGIALLAVVSFFLFRPGPPVPPEELFAIYYEPYNASLELRTDTIIPRDLLEPAFAKYEKSEYDSAQQAFDEILVRYPSHPRATFYLGMCQLELENLADAEKSFQFVLDHGKNLYLYQAAWYLALVCLKQEDKTCVRENLAPLTKQSNTYREGAENILQELED